MKIHLSEVLSETGKKRVYKVPVGFKSVSYAGTEAPVLEAEEAVISLENRGQRKLDAVVDAKFVLVLPCDRCMEDVKVPVTIASELEIDMNEPMPGELTPEEQDAETERIQEQPFVEGHELDTDRLLLQEISFNLPERVLCREDCKGICMKCGKNLNHGACNCEEEPKDLRMMAFLDVFKAANEDK